jgi:ribonuclease BN (tRNA processing enzyme)
MLRFVGTGSAFHTRLGNNSAYIKEGDRLLLIDCGGTVFHRLKEKGILDGITGLYILITHPHPDHVGSLGDIIFYAFYKLKIIPQVFFPDGDWLRRFFRQTGVKPEKYILNTEKYVILSDPQLGTLEITFTPVIHTDTLPCFGFVLKREGTSIYYSGDAREIPLEILNAFNKGEISVLYQDTSGMDYPGNPHLSFTRLVSLIPPERRNQVTCMHLDEQFPVELARSMGFQVAQN